MKVNLKIYNVIFDDVKQLNIQFDNYDDKYFPPKPKGELTFEKMFEYWSKLLKEQYNLDIPTSYFDMTKNIGIDFEITKI